jgi:alginate O-acetyltransferase complex protein AlgI
MVFSSILFLFIYLPVVLAVYYIVPVKWRMSGSLSSTWCFTAGASLFISLMLLCISVNYCSGLLIEKYRADDKKARLVLALSTIVSLAFCCSSNNTTCSPVR